MRTLIDTGVKVDHVNRLGAAALLEAIALGDGGERHVRIVQLLVDAKADVNLADSNGETPLWHARSRGIRRSSGFRGQRKGSGVSGDAICARCRCREAGGGTRRPDSRSSRTTVCNRVSRYR
ncbi:hypothetical protein [Burkholderia sp. Bp8977]|uniref:hypothetical protein n=1 Tax=unclassified Burkholderia TaxID=2613784 RepID=UPI003908B7D6